MKDFKIKELEEDPLQRLVKEKVIEHEIKSNVVIIPNKTYDFKYSIF